MTAHRLPAVIIISSNDPRLGIHSSLILPISSFSWDRMSNISNICSVETFHPISSLIPDSIRNKGTSTHWKMQHRRSGLVIALIGRIRRILTIKRTWVKEFCNLMDAQQMLVPTCTHEWSIQFGDILQRQVLSCLLLTSGSKGDTESVSVCTTGHAPRSSYNLCQSGSDGMLVLNKCYTAVRMGASC
jgi:hypothetical protein